MSTIEFARIKNQIKTNHLWLETLFITDPYLIDHHNILSVKGDGSLGISIRENDGGKLIVTEQCQNIDEYELELLTLLTGLSWMYTGESDETKTSICNDQVENSVYKQLIIHTRSLYLKNLLMEWLDIWAKQDFKILNTNHINVGGNIVLEEPTKERPHTDLLKKIYEQIHLNNINIVVKLQFSPIYSIFNILKFNFYRPYFPQCLSNEICKKIINYISS